MRGRTLAWMIVGVSSVAFVVAMAGITTRVRDFNRDRNFVRWHADVFQQRVIELPGYPKLTLTDRPDLDPVPEGGKPIPAPTPDDKPIVTPAGESGGISTIELDFAGKKTLIPVKAPAASHLPNLALYQEWLTVLGVTEVGIDQPTPGPNAISVAKPGSGRLMIVVRSTPAGFEPEGWGSVRRIEWVFHFFELKPDGTIEQFQRRMPRKYRSEARLQREAKAIDDKTGEPLYPHSTALATIAPLDQRGVEYYMALHVIPKMNVPGYKFNDTAFDVKVLGWTLPVGMLSVLLWPVALVFAIAPRKRGPAASV